MSIRRQISYLAGLGLHCAGLGRLYVRVRGSAGAVVLMYHSVAKPEQAVWIDPDNHVPADAFEAQMRFLSRKRRVLALAELLRLLEEGRRPPAGAAAITFDDGYLDNLTVAAPILKRYGLPAMLYLPTAYIAAGMTQWIDELYTIFRTRTQTRFQLPAGGPWFDLRGAGRRRAYQAAIKLLLSARLPERQDWLADIARQLAPRLTPPRLTMTWSEVRELRRVHARFELGAHTCDHLDLSAHGGATARAEIERSIEEIARETGERPVHFSYPYSRLTPQVRETVKELGMLSAVGADRNCLIGPAADRFNLPRVAAPRSLASLSFLTSGAYPDLLPGALLRRAAARFRHTDGLHARQSS